MAFNAYLVDVPFLARCGKAVEFVARGKIVVAQVNAAEPHVEDSSASLVGHAPRTLAAIGLHEQPVQHRVQRSDAIDLVMN